MKHANILLLGITALTLLSGCERGATTLSVTGGDPITYLCEQNNKVQVRYFALSDDSLNFIKLSLPDGKDYTLPQAVSASGARYTDDHEVVWWNKGKEGFVEMRDKDGEWQSLYNDCKEQ
ncbi:MULTISPECIES: MliC family protein [Aeromonas]|uniref:MliC family protein n=1 Tax=Aeromonas TaxID=642 RepID=UPI00051B2723|nr:MULTISPECIES: MliC family protein [Aeromonas]MCH7371674.1 MliC family protein [Aeromonas sp. MR16]